MLLFLDAKKKATLLQNVIFNSECVCTGGGAVHPNIHCDNMSPSTPIIIFLWIESKSEEKAEEKEAPETKSKAEAETESEVK